LLGVWSCVAISSSKSDWFNRSCRTSSSSDEARFSSFCGAEELAPKLKFSNPLFASPPKQPDPGGFVSAQIENEAAFAEISREIGEEVLHLTPKPSPSKPTWTSVFKPRKMPQRLPHPAGNPYNLIHAYVPMPPDIIFPEDDD
jgi:hypothetical protein